MLPIDYSPHRGACARRAPPNRENMVTNLRAACSGIVLWPVCEVVDPAAKTVIHICYQNAKVEHTMRTMRSIHSYFKTAFIERGWWSFVLWLVPLLLFTLLIPHNVEICSCMNLPWTFRQVVAIAVWRPWQTDNSHSAFIYLTFHLGVPAMMMAGRYSTNPAFIKTPGIVVAASGETFRKSCYCS
jgi:hypothetical protein